LRRRGTASPLGTRSSSDIPGFAELIAAGADAPAFERLRCTASLIRPPGSSAFLARIERQAQRRLRPAPLANGSQELSPPSP
jgi:hypothetical protein